MIKIDVFDTYADKKSGEIMHFDVLVPHGTSGELAYEYAQSWLKSINATDVSLEQKHCRFCHSQMSNPTVEAAIESEGYYILQLEGCPVPNVA